MARPPHIHGHAAETAARIETRLVGEQWVTSALAAIARGIACGLDLATCAAAVKSIEPAFGRYSAHPRPDGEVYVLDSREAPYWTIPSALRLVANARASRKTVLFGTISDYAGAGGHATAAPPGTPFKWPIA